SKGACVFLGFQDIEGLRKVYGAEVANELVGQVSNIAILGLNSPATAKWASELFGEYEGYEYQESSTAGSGQASRTVSQQLVKREAVLPSEFLLRARTTPQTGLKGYYVIPDVGAYQTVLSGEWIAKGLSRRSTTVADYLPRPVEHQYLRPWTQDDLK